MQRVHIHTCTCNVCCLHIYMYTYLVYPAHFDAVTEGKMKMCGRYFSISSLLYTSTNSPLSSLHSLSIVSSHPSHSSHPHSLPCICILLFHSPSPQTCVLHVETWNVLLSILCSREDCARSARLILYTCIYIIMQGGSAADIEPRH